MAKTAVIITRVEPELKRNAENVLDELGLTMSQAVLLYFKQIELHHGLPFPVKIPGTSASYIDQLLAPPIKMETFEPLTREELHER